MKISKRVKIKIVGDWTPIKNSDIADTNARLKKAMRPIIMENAYKQVMSARAAKKMMINT